MIKNIYFLISLMVLCLSQTTIAQVKIGTNSTVIDNSAELEIESTNRGFLPPRLTTAQRDVIQSPAEGLTIYNTTTKCLNFYDGTAWVSLCDTGGESGGETPLTYCNISVQWQVYTITYVNFAGIDNSTANTATMDAATEDFTAISGSVTAGQSYTITLKGNTGSWAPQVCYFTVFIDFNHNGVLDDAGEVFQAGTVTGTTGLDNVSATASIAIPAGALTGETRMRVLYNTDSYAMAPCATYSWAQSEDYTLNITN